MIDLLSLSADARVLDIGAGRGEFLLRIIERYGARGVAVEINEHFVQRMQKNAEQHGVADKLQVIQQDAMAVVEDLAQTAFDVVVCTGASQALGGSQTALGHLTNLIKRGGYVILGEGYWKRTPDKPYLEALGAAEHELQSHSTNVFAAQQHGLVPLWSAVASEDDWDAYEWLYSKSVEDYCYLHPSDPDVPMMLERIRSWRKVYLEWGRDTLGFGLYLFGLR